eukprot:3102623-Pleurochrysis_carterae.AAC.2
MRLARAIHPMRRARTDASQIPEIGNRHECDLYFRVAVKGCAPIPELSLAGIAEQRDCSKDLLAGRKRRPALGAKRSVATIKRMQ